MSINSIDSYINSVNSQLTPKKPTRKTANLHMLRYLVSPRQYKGVTEPVENKITSEYKYNIEDGIYNIVYVLFNNQQEIWRSYFSTKSLQVVQSLRTNKKGRIEQICDNNGKAIAHVNDDELISKLSKIKLAYKEPIVLHHLEVPYHDGMNKFSSVREL